MEKKGNNETAKFETGSRRTLLCTEVKSCLFYLDQESNEFADPEMERNIQGTSPNLTQLLNQTTSFSNESLANQLPMTSRRRRRGIGWRGGRLDWWYGNWCGPYQGGYTNNPKPSCKGVCRTTSYVSSACRKCLPTIDGLDEACMEHDR